MSASHPTVNLAEYLERSARAFSERIAVVDPDGSLLTYRDLQTHAGRVAGFLASHGVRSGTRVGLLLRKSAAAVTAIFGILKARAAYVPVDPTAPSDRNSAILADCDVQAVFVEEGLDDPIWNNSASRPELVVRVGSDHSPHASGMSNRGYRWRDVIGQDYPFSVNGRNDEDLAYILYTSGSTGVPKGVMLSHRNAISFVDWCSSVFVPTEHDRFSSHAPFHFDLSILDIYVSLKHGGALFLISDNLGKSPKELAQFIARHRLTVWYSTPSILTLLAQYGDVARLDLTSLRLVLFAGEVFPVKHLRETVKLFPRARFFNLYGPTETNVCTSAEIPTPVPEDRIAPYPIGWPCSHCADLVLDEPGGVSLPPGQEGLLHIAGPSVFQGYWNRPRENASAFIDRDGLRWYNTGDVVRADPQDGYVYVGRRDRMVKRRGYRIELGEIEKALYQHDRIREAAVIALPDANAGVRILANVVARSNERPSIIELKTFCSNHLPAYMSPDVFRFLEALPRTSTDKIDYQSLLRLASSGHQEGRS